MKKVIIAIALLVVIIILSLIFDQRNVANMETKKEEVLSPTPGNVVAVMKTNFGDIKLELYANDAPKTVENFVRLSESKFYNDTRFHRVIKDFMIQGGDGFTKDESLKDRWGTGNPGYVFEDEINDHKLVRGVLAMANAGPNTNGSQFFIVTAESTPWLDGKHTVFGRVIDGMNVVDKIENLPTGENDVPLKDAIVEEVVIEK